MFLCSSILIGCGNGLTNSPDAKSENSMKEETKEIPKDIILRLKHDFDNEVEYQEALDMLNQVKHDVLNVGWIQLSRAIILIADGNINKMKEIIESGYDGDPRDVIMNMMGLPNNTNDHGMTPFVTNK